MPYGNSEGQGQLLLPILAEYEIFSANKYERPTIVGIFIFISIEIFLLSYV